MPLNRNFQRLIFYQNVQKQKFLKAKYELNTRVLLYTTYHAIITMKQLPLLAIS